MLGEALANLFPHMPPEFGPNAALIYQSIFDDLPLREWSLEGTRLTRSVNGKLLSFAPRRTHCTIGFRGREALEFYRFVGGKCPAGEVTIKVLYDADWDALPIKKTIDWYFHADVSE